MNFAKRRQYQAWLGATLEKEALSREEISQILQGQLLLPAKDRDAGLMAECANALNELEGETLPNKDKTWARIAADMNAIAARRAGVPRRRTAFVLAVVLLLLMAAALAAALSPRVFSFLWGEGNPESYVQKDAAGLLKTNLASLSREHVEIVIREAAYDGRELRVVYSVRNKQYDKLYTERDVFGEGETQLYKAAMLDGLGTVCDWIEINGEHVYFSDCGTKPGDKPGEMLYYDQALLADQGVYLTGDFTVGLPLGRQQERPMSFVPKELEFTMNAEEALRLVQAGLPGENTVNGIRIQLTEGSFSPVAGALYLRFSGEDKKLLEETAYRWWSAQLYTPDGEQVGRCSPEMLDDRDMPRSISCKIDVVPPEVWPEEMLFILPEADGTVDLAKGVPVRLAPKDGPP